MKHTHTALKLFPKQHSLSRQLSVWFAFLALLGLGLVSIFVYTVTAINFFKSRDETMLQFASTITNIVANHHSSGLKKEITQQLDAYLIRHPEMQLELSNEAKNLIYSSPQKRALTASKHSRLFAIKLPGSGIFWQAQLTLDTQADQRRLQQLALTLLAAALTGTGVLSLGGFILVRLGLTPIQCLAEQTRGIDGQNRNPQLSSHCQPAELVPLVDQFNALLQRNEQAYQQLESFNADVAHELCTPLATLITSNELALRQHKSPSTDSDILESNLEELHRISNIVQDMLFLARADRGGQARRVAVASLAYLTEQVVDYHEAALSEADLKISIIGDASGYFDAPLLQRALSNLLGNASQYAQAGSEVQIQIAPQAPNAVLLQVRNHCKKIPAPQLARLFDRFFRLDPMRAHDGHNHHGLGLAIVAAIARMHKGHVFAESNDSTTVIGISLANASDQAKDGTSNGA